MIDTVRDVMFNITMYFKSRSEGDAEGGVLLEVYC